LIPTGERSGLPTRIAKTVSGFIVSADERLTAFLELETVTRESFRFPNAFSIKTADQTEDFPILGEFSKLRPVNLVEE